MKELSLYILDIAMNSINAGANNILITINENAEQLKITIKDDGCGMTADQVEKLSDPFFTTRTTRKVGFGIPLFKLSAEQSDGYISITSTPKSDKKEKHGTTVSTLFNKKHIDFTPLGDIILTITTLLQGNPEVNIDFNHIINDKKINLSTTEIKKHLGESIPLNTPEILFWIKEYLAEQYDSIIN